MTKQRILILMSNTGGGHRASALALEAGFKALFPDRFEIEIIDLLTDYTFWPLSRAPQIYAEIATHAPWLWGAAYTTQYAPNFIHSSMVVPARLARTKILRALDRFVPDLIISVHPLAQDIVLPSLAEWRAKMQRATSYVTVVTDLASAHPLWLHKDVDACYVASDEAVRAAQEAGIAPERIHRLGLPVRLAFAGHYPPPNEMKERLELDTTLPAALLMGGGDGVGPVETIAAALDQALVERGKPMGQLVIICGRNAELRTRLEETNWQIPVRVLGFVEEMPAWMHACDCIVTKAGPGTMAEAFICSLPILLSGFIPGQEEGNIAYMLEHGAGAYERDPQRIAQQVRRWFGANTAQRLAMAERSHQLARPHATHDIVRSIAALLDPL